MYTVSPFVSQVYLFVGLFVFISLMQNTDLSILASLVANTTAFFELFATCSYVYHIIHIHEFIELLIFWTT